MLSLPRVASKTDLIVETLREVILRGDLRPGERLKQEAVAEQMGVSQAPVREAFRRLAHEGLLTIIPNHGAVVSVFEPEVVRQVYRIRGTLEGLATQMAVENLPSAELASLTARLRALHDQMQALVRRSQIGGLPRIDRTFHRSIFDACRSNRLIGLIQQLREERFQDNTFWIPGRAQQSIVEHQTIISALAARDARAANDAARAHVENVGQAVCQHFGVTGRSSLDDALALPATNSACRSGGQ